MADYYVPEDLEQLCIDLVALVYQDKRNVQSERIWSWSRTFDTNRDDPLFAPTLEFYTRHCL